MNELLEREATILHLRAGTAADLMSLNPVSISETAGLHDALELLTDKGFSAAPVIDEAGRPVGVISRSDLLVHQRETVHHPATHEREHIPDGFEVEEVDPTLVADVMTPVVFSVAHDASSRSVVEQLLSLKVHRLFVIDDAGVLIGVVTATDILRHLVP